MDYQTFYDFRAFHNKDEIACEYSDSDMFHPSIVQQPDQHGSNCIVQHIYPKIFYEGYVWIWLFLVMEEWEHNSPWSHLEKDISNESVNILVYLFDYKDPPFVYK